MCLLSRDVFGKGIQDLEGDPLEWRSQHWKSVFLKLSKMYSILSSSHSQNTSDQNVLKFDKTYVLIFYSIGMFKYEPLCKELPVSYRIKSNCTNIYFPLQIVGWLVVYGLRRKITLGTWCAKNRNKKEEIKTNKK